MNPYQIEHLNQKLKQALEYLGNRYVLHPRYNPKDNPKHLMKAIDYK